MVSSGLLRRVALVRTDVSEERGASFIRVTKIGELETTQAATSNRRTLRRNTNDERCVRRLLVTASVVPSSTILVTLMKEAQFPPKRRFLQEPHGETSQKTPFFKLHNVCNLRQRSLRIDVCSVLLAVIIILCLVDGRDFYVTN
jgi:hypothetical protein